ncbi:hypothetical protein GFC29_1186 [Anoxybacillus sp. B7M1]|jgi:hypothetical protein|uniref:YndM family protein n=1 Tax=unclassified Anoxybacillus TaxID=2639704 RepID=UPI0005CD2D50|nr:MULTISPECIES: YndM family protein [unclassified Anoxybacillus]ANB57462.1 hypothetical protein GFC28_438 [Anoxybacillus sp. B2M1]ANB63099.1 hypothetical protein GFC29_1186 [Anoxybacillus sp. B7M1]
MKHILSLVIKYILLTTIFFSIIPLFLRVSTAELLWLSLVMTCFAYAIGDLWILTRFGNLSATIADFGLVFFGLWIGVGSFYTASAAVLNASFFTALLVALGEAPFHAYMQQIVLRDGKVAEERPAKPLIPSVQMETAEELDPNHKNPKS